VDTSSGRGKISEACFLLPLLAALVLVQRFDIIAGMEHCEMFRVIGSVVVSTSSMPAISGLFLISLTLFNLVGWELEWAEF
jgi:hypothetical protein